MAERKPGKRTAYNLIRILIFLVLLSAAAFIAYRAVEGYQENRLSYFLEEYRSVQPGDLKAFVMERYFDGADMERCLDRLLDDAAAGKTDTGLFESEGSLMARLLEMLRNDPPKAYISYENYDVSSVPATVTAETAGDVVSAFNAHGPITVTVCCGGSEFAKFLFDHSSQKTVSGFRKYEYVSCEFFPPEKREILITVPHGAQIDVNGVRVTSDCLTGNRTEAKDADRMPEGEPGLYYEEYRITGLLSEPEIRVTDADGSMMTVQKLPDGTFRCERGYSEKLRGEYSRYVLDALEYNAVYKQYDCPASYFIDSFENGSKAHTWAKSIFKYFVVDHSGYTITEEQAEEFLAYSDRVFSCRVRFTHKLLRYGRDDFTNYVDMNLWLRRGADGRFRIYDYDINY